MHLGEEKKMTNNNLYWNLAFLSITIVVEVEVVVVVPMTLLLVQKAGIFLLIYDCGYLWI